jgi:hypothetical protein
MANTYIEINGRLVQGHPMIYNSEVDNRTGKPRTKADNITPADPTMFIAVAVPKTGEQHWNQTVWGRVLHDEATKGWPRGEWQMKDFAWKVTDGDSTELNTKMRRPCDNEGFPGHWIVYGRTSLPVQCFANGKYGQGDLLRDPKMIKTGDYCRVLIYIKPNGSTQSPGMYLNPFGFDMTRAGEEIISGPDAGAMFGQSAPVIPPNAKLDPAVGNVPPPTTTPPPPAASAVVAPPPSAPNMGFVQGPPAPPSAGPPAPPAAPVVHRVASNGQQYTEEQLKGFGWTPEQINALPIGTGNDIPF